MAVQGVTCQDPAARQPLHGAIDVTQQQETSPQRNVENEGLGGDERLKEERASVSAVVPRYESPADKMGQWILT